jgi:hypothetical protein
MRNHSYGFQDVFFGGLCGVCPYSPDCLEEEFCEVHGYKGLRDAAQINLEGFVSGTSPTQHAHYRHFRYSEVWQTVATCNAGTSREF